MSEARLLSLVARYPHRAALVRRVRDGSTFTALRHLEERGFLRRRGDDYLLTHRGRDELALVGVLARLMARTRNQMR